MFGEPKVISEGYAYIDEEKEKWCLKEDAPEWAVKEFNEFFGNINDDNDEIITKY